MAITLPATAKALGRTSVVVLTTPPAAITGIPTTVEINAGVFLSLHFYTPFNMQPNQNTGEGPRKLGSQSVPTENGLVTYPATEVSYSYLPQSLGTPGNAANKAYETLVPGTKRTIVVLKDVPGDQSVVTVGQVADIALVDPGVRRKGETGDSEFDQFNVLQSLVVVGGALVAEDRVLAAS